MTHRGAVLLAAALLLAGCSSSHHPSSANGTPADADCLALTGKPVNAAAICDAPVAGISQPKSFPCYANPSESFYYFNVGSREYVYGITGGVWKAAPFTQSLGPITTDVGC